jgi:protein-S-isoprenylcysteine O-methyltransferase Ste14
MEKMTEEEIFALVFKIILIVLYSSFTIIRINIARIIRKSNKNNEIKEKIIHVRFLEIYIVITIIVFFLFILMPEWFNWSAIPNYPRWIQWIGTTIGVLSIVLFVFVHIHLGKNFSYKLAIYDDHRLVKTGPYKFIRHPMYTAFIMLHVAIFLITANWFFGIIWIGGLTIILIFRIKREEKMLIDVFGEEYKNYIKHTGSLLPNLIKIIKSKNNKELIEDETESN